MYRLFLKKLPSRALILTLLACAINVSYAKKIDLNQEVKISSSRTAADLKNKIFSYIDNVVITQGTLIIHANLVQVISQGENDDKTYIAKGNPATFEQVLEDGKPINLQANEIRYEPTLNTVFLSGNALLRQEGSEVSGSIITYNAETEYVNAESDSHNRVKTIIQPQTQSKDEQ
ncbi:MAG: lipopolysaccharide export system protein LptA [Alteromonadaceae bacterium]|jgi:lipopolysaccharide export system protein LptA